MLTCQSLANQPICLSEKYVRTSERQANKTRIWRWVLREGSLWFCVPSFTFWWRFIMQPVSLPWTLETEGSLIKGMNLRIKCTGLTLFLSLVDFCLLAAPSFLQVYLFKRYYSVFFDVSAAIADCDLWFVLPSNRLEAAMDGHGEDAILLFVLCVCSWFRFHLIYHQTDGLAVILYGDREKLAAIFLQRMVTEFFRNWIHRPEWPRPSVTCVCRASAGLSTQSSGDAGWPKVWRAAWIYKMNCFIMTSSQFSLILGCCCFAFEKKCYVYMFNR